MADPIRKQIIDAVIARLRGITVANGYLTDIGNNVVFMPVATIAFDELPAVTVTDTGCTYTEWTCGQSENVIDCEIRIIFATASYTMEDIYSAIRDIVTAIAMDRTWGDRAIETNLESDQIEINQDEDTIGRATIQIKITYISQKWTF